jgi:ABC-type amino acid transport substrate-binding protein
MRKPFLAAVLATGLAGPLAAAELPAPSFPNRLRVLVSADEMPEVFSFSYRPGDPPGFERELVEGFTRSRKLELQVVTVKNWDQIIPMLMRGEGDLIVGIVDTESRRKRISFTKEIYPVRHVVVTRQPAPPVTTAAQLRGMRVGVIPGTTWAEAAREAGVPASNTVPCADLNDALDALRTGRAAATVVAVFDYALARKYDRALEAGVFLGASGTAAWAVRKDDGALLAALDEYLEALRHSPVRSNLAVKYFSEEALSLLRRARQQ